MPPLRLTSAILPTMAGVINGFICAIRVSSTTMGFARYILQMSTQCDCYRWLRKDRKHAEIQLCNYLFQRSQHLVETVRTSSRPRVIVTTGWLIIPNQDTGRWLQIKLTERLGSLANTKVTTLTESFGRFQTHNRTNNFSRFVPSSLQLRKAS